jgi:very-short-patch-repair endonuclease
VVYKGSNSKVIIICPKHGEFIQKATTHIQKCGCPICRESKGEISIRKFLSEKNINFISQYKFDDCRNKLPLSFDFYLTDYNICIEFDGRQHFVVGLLFSRYIEDIQLRDKIKNKYCKKNNIKLIRIRFDENILKKLSIILKRMKII